MRAWQAVTQSASKQGKNENNNKGSGYLQYDTE